MQVDKGHGLEVAGVAGIQFFRLAAVPHGLVEATHAEIQTGQAGYGVLESRLAFEHVQQLPLGQ